VYVTTIVYLLWSEEEYSVIEQLLKYWWSTNVDLEKYPDTERSMREIIELLQKRSGRFQSILECAYTYLVLISTRQLRIRELEQLLQLATEALTK